jgi:diaminohydroxyphosphoribosylaminopyrimidine deaminase/5-amino-6-(5-phosphoribosylamino)uracil reductase
LGEGPVIIITTPENMEKSPDRARALQAAGARLEPVGGGDLRAALGRLADLEIVSLLLEGGTELHRSAWNAGLVDAVHLYVAPVELGERGVRWLDADEVAIAGLAECRTVPLGPDVFMEGYVHGID